jgi:hypothetical protein
MIRMRERYWNVDDPNRTPLRDNPDVSHEQSDVNIRTILSFGIGLVIVIVVAQIGLYWLLAQYEERSARSGRVVSAPDAEEQMPPPRLQISPRNDLAEMRAAEDRELTTYGWVDKEKQTVRIPIDRAMELVAQRGLPARKQAEETGKGR